MTENEPLRGIKTLKTICGKTIDCYKVESRPLEMNRNIICIECYKFLLEKQINTMVWIVASAIEEDMRTFLAKTTNLSNKVIIEEWRKRNEKK